MDNIKKITSFTHHKTAEGSRISATYSEISEDGKLIKSNERFNIVIVDDDMQSHVDAITRILTSKIPT